ncbi:MAG TPA: hypothetical protein PL140_09100 [Ferrovaceae bacterium]|uniref:hypothetical protein n=1 Tax=Ferrovum sp. JA12 TaxID=1356299 RepID=UPI000AFF2631|nr:hypothetical protein [Ferrovum sp. JA12]HQT82110.1 hypothetical protein [Ferrovaceae bacterium]HQU07376.1 hypothetical protein [Ferrovaceae bacterium]
MKEWAMYIGFFILALNLAMLAIFMSPESWVLRTIVGGLSAACWFLVFKFKPR